MKVGFFHAGPSGTPHVLLAAQMIRSVRRQMPDVEIVQFTHAHSVTMADVDRKVVRPTLPLALAVLDAYATFSGEWLYVDTDVLVQRDVRHVFDRSFDVAVATREGTLKDAEIGTKFMARMPYNKGAVFSRSQAFWRASVETLKQAKPARQAWMGDQQAMNDVIAAGMFHVETLPAEYNYAPHSRTEDVSDKFLTHWKGSRKAWLLERAA